jgi:hypothetical protein
MMESLHRYRALSAADRWLVVEAAMLLAVARLGIASVPFPVLRRALDRSGHIFRRRPHGESESSVARLAWAVAAVARRVPFRSTCLVESLAADAMLRRRGYASEIRFGVRAPSGGDLAAHAWVEHEGAVVFGAVHELAEYSVLSSREAE